MAISGVTFSFAVLTFLSSLNEKRMEMIISHPYIIAPSALTLTLKTSLKPLDFVRHC